MGAQVLLMFSWRCRDCRGGGGGGAGFGEGRWEGEMKWGLGCGGRGD